MDASMHHPVPHRAGLQVWAVSFQPCQQRLQRGGMIRKVIPLVDQRRAVGVRDMQTSLGNADSLDLPGEQPRFPPAHLIESNLKTGRAGVDGEYPLDGLIKHRR